MKNKILVLLTLIGIVIGVQAQYPCLNGISTDPLNPINTQLPSRKNTFFNWQDSIYQVQPINSGCIRGSQMESPFFKIDNLEALRESKDMKWEDGWELIRRGFGLNEQNINTTDLVPNSYLILYNKYTGNLRVLLKICTGSDYNAAAITLSFDGLSQIKTDLLEISRGSISALDKVFSNTAFSGGSVYFNDNTKWFYADFPMTFDPCTCNYKSKLNIVSKLISTSVINLEGTIAGDIYTKNVGGKAQIQKPGSYTWKDFTGSVNGKVSNTNASINNFITNSQILAANIGNIDTVNKKQAIDNLANFLKNNQFLKAVLNAVPWLSAAVSFLDIFIGGGKTSTGPQEVKLMPLSVNLTAKLNGTIATTNPFHNIIFTNPGSKDAQLDPNAYPYYNEVLGVFNLLKTPVVFSGIGTSNSMCCDARRCYPTIKEKITLLRFDVDSFQYVVNSAANVSIENMKAALVIETTTGITFPNLANITFNGSFPILEGKDLINNTYKFRTDYFDIKCLDQNSFNYFNINGLCQRYTNSRGFSVTGNMFIKLMMRLKRNNSTTNTQDLLYVLTYPVKLVTDQTLVSTPSPVTCDSLVIPQASNADINSFCNSITYNNISRQSRQYLDSLTKVKILEKDGIAVNPNPNNGSFKVVINKLKANLSSLNIVDMTGKSVYVSNEGNIKLDDGFNKSITLDLKSGAYIIRAITSLKVLKTKILIVK